MKLYENHEPARPFPCPVCREYLAISATECRFCGAEIDPEFAQAAARREALGNRLYRKKHYTKHFRIGGPLLALGLIIMIGSYLLAREVLQTDFVWIPRTLIVGGGGDFLSGVYGLVSEARSAKREML